MPGTTYLDPPEKEAPMKTFSLALPLAVAAVVIAPSAFAQYSPQTVPSMPLSTFKNNIGVTTHFEYSDGLYANYQKVIADMQAIGVMHARDSVPVPTYWASIGVPDVEAAMQSNIKFDLIASPLQNLTTNIAQIHVLTQYNAGGVESIEGYNEINNSGGLVNESQAETFQYALYQAVHADPALQGDPVLDFTGLVQHNLSQLVNFANYANIHPYPKGGQAPEATINLGFSENYVTSTTGAITEFGYYTGQDGVDGVDDESQASYLFDGIFDNALAGDYRTYIYELLDAYPNNSYGLFNYNDGEPKLSAQWLENMHTVIPLDVASSPRAVQVTEALDSNGVLTSGLPANVKQLAVTDSKGNIYLWTWNEQTIYNEQTQSSTAATYQPFLLQIPNGTYTTSYFVPDVDFAMPESPVGIYEGANYFESYYTTHPTCTIFTKM
jgi:hypothetical protein